MASRSCDSVESATVVSPCGPQTLPPSVSEPIFVQTPRVVRQRPPVSPTGEGDEVQRLAQRLGRRRVRVPQFRLFARFRCTASTQPPTQAAAIHVHNASIAQPRWREQRTHGAHHPDRQPRPPTASVASSRCSPALPKNSDCALRATVTPAKAGIQAGRLRGCLVDSRFRGNDEFGTQLSSWAKPCSPATWLAQPRCFLSSRTAA
jgi:hypothetical protein